MSRKIAIICHSDHHIQKSLLLQKEFLSETKIFYAKNKFLEAVEDNSIKPISSKFISSFDIFIFYTLHSNKNNVRLYGLIRKQKKVIVAFQESHQLEMHGGDVNNLILHADLIFTASLAEKNLLVSNFYYNGDQIKTYGWLFSDDMSDYEFHEDKHQNNVLLILTAPKSITASSYETSSSRSELIATILDLNPEQRLYIKPHPLEDISDLESIIQIHRNKKNNIYLIQSQQSFDDAILSSNIIYTSNRTQSCIDLIGTRKLVIYALGPDNFIISHAKEFNLEFKANSIRFIEFFSDESITSFQSQYINQDIINFRNAENSILELSYSSDMNLDYNLENILWQYIHGFVSKKTLLNFLAENSLQNVIQIIERPDKTTQNELDFVNGNLSIKTSIFLIYLREITASNIPINENAIYIIKKNVTRWFAQYYSLDAIHLFFFLKNISLEDQALEKKSASLILNSIQILQKKSLILNLFILLSDRISRLKNIQIKLQIFKLLNLVWGILKK
jgi:hypothetical protein